jgi:hypothetical protein
MGSEWILGRLARDVNWIRLAQDRDRSGGELSLYLDGYITIHLDPHTDISID